MVVTVERASLVALVAALLLGGCASEPKLGQWEGPKNATGRSVDNWAYGGKPAQRIRSPHYQIYTTLDDQDTLNRLPQIMEGGLCMYQRVAPEVSLSAEPMDCFVFEKRSEYDSFTKQTTGSDANVYLQIRRGGYSVGDRFVCYYIGADTNAVAAHEGWHQFLGRNFKGRLPPFLEEGMACMFEGVAFDGELPQWNLSVNQTRATALRKAVDGNYLWPLDQLIALHAGDIVGDRMEKIDAFYAQSWAFARFLWEADDGKYRPALQKWLAETAKGTVYDPTGSHCRLCTPWNRRAVKPMLEHYLGMSLPEIDKAYQEFLHKAAYEQFAAQFHS